MGIGRGRRLLVAAVIVLGGAVVVGAMVSGPAQVGPPRWTPGAPPAPPPVTAHPMDSATPSVAKGSPALLDTLLNVLLVVVVVLIGVAILGVVIRGLRSRRVLRTAGAVAAGQAAASVISEDAASAPAVRRGIARALAILAEPREPRDAVVQAWLGLEDAAAASGLARSPAETPSEYAARIIRRFDTDRAAADALRRLYEDVRFGDSPVDAEAVRSARASLLRLQASWHDEAGASAREMRVR